VGDVIAVCGVVGERAEVARRLRELADWVDQGDAGRDESSVVREEGANGEQLLQLQRYYAVLATESDGDPVAMFRRAADAADYAAGKPVSLVDAEDGTLNTDYCVCRVDVTGGLWNSYDADPHDDWSEPHAA
jgi:hypothetical protein